MVRTKPTLKSIRLCLEYRTVDDTEVKMIIARLVPTACCGENPEIRVRKGTMNTPPPMPIMAATIPTRNATKGAKIMSKGIIGVSP
jgi:hypothetical protein